MAKWLYTQYTSLRDQLHAQMAQHIVYDHIILRDQLHAQMALYAVHILRDHLHAQMALYTVHILRDHLHAQMAQHTVYIHIKRSPPCLNGCMYTQYKYQGITSMACPNGCIHSAITQIVVPCQKYPKCMGA